MLDAEVGAFDTRHALTRVNVAGATLMMPGWIGEPGSTRRVRIADAAAQCAGASVAQLVG